MDRLTNGPRSRAVVCHSNKLVAEDLRQLLLMAGASAVVVVGNLADVTIGMDGIAFVEGSAINIAQTAPVQAWLRVGTPVVSLNGGRLDPSLPSGLHALEQPFRSEDVLRLVSILEIF